MIDYQFGVLNRLATSIVCAGMGEGEHEEEQQPQIKEIPTVESRRTQRATGNGRRGVTALCPLHRHLQLGHVVRGLGEQAWSFDIHFPVRAADAVSVGLDPGH